MTKFGNRTDLENDDNVVVDKEYRDTDNHGINWLPLLAIPLLLLGALMLWPALTDNNSTVNNGIENNGRPEVGVGGGPEDSDPTPTITPTASPTPTSVITPTDTPPDYVPGVDIRVD